MSTLKVLTGESAALLKPVIALNCWTLAMEAWLYATRIPAMSKYKIDTNPNKIVKEFDEKIPPSVKWKADNYNHLMEQPTQYYATALTLALMGANDSTTVGLAWTYTGLRVVHSLVQATVNDIPTRFSLFALSSITLLGMTVKAVTLLL